MSAPLSPLRYPGGKVVLSDFMMDVILGNNLEGCSYIEPFAGGAGAALTLLFEGIVKNLYLNDADITIAAFWYSALEETEKLLKIIHDTPITIDEWKKQKEILLNERADLLKLGFAAFFLNRCNRSGIIYSAGPIGGYGQTDSWTIDVRFNKNSLKKRIEKIALHKDKIAISNQDAIDFLKMTAIDVLKTSFIYLDPPYFMNGKKLYMNYYREDDHRKLSDYIRGWRNIHWLMTYDDVEFIHTLYNDYRLFSYSLNYSLHEKRKGEELLIIPPGIYLPAFIKLNGKLIPLSQQSTKKGENYG
ncbi:MAG: DNA adenine methylase [Candidatus Aminicenantes bacterium]|nr:DNA adenine methylase [Candidatus Aminicenantes bacterium]